LSLSPARLALDGILFDEIHSDAAHGKVWEHDGWYAFTLTLPDLEFTRGAFLGAAWDVETDSERSV